MAELSIDVSESHDRGLVRVRVPIDVAAQVAAAACFPVEPLLVYEGEPAILWVAPDQWLMVSESRPATALLDDLSARLAGTLHHASDASDALALITLTGRRARTLLMMLSSIDYDVASFPAGRCVRTRIAKVAVLVRAVARDRFDLFVDRSVAGYLESCLRYAARDPRLCA